MSRKEHRIAADWIVGWALRIGTALLWIASVQAATPPAGSVPSLEIQNVKVISGDVVRPEFGVVSAAYDGGFLVVNFLGTKQVELLQIGQNAIEASRHTIDMPAEELFRWTSATPDGFIIGGSALSKDVRDDAVQPLKYEIRRTIEFDSLRKIDSHGRESPGIRVSPIADGHQASCGASTAEGFVVLGIKETALQEAKPVVPWIGVAAKDGSRLWERAFTEVDGEMVVWPLGGVPRDDCAGLQIAKDGTITWAMRVKMFPTVHSQEDLVKTSLFEYIERPSTLIVQLDSRGNVLRQAVHPYTAGAVLLQRPDGFTLVEGLTRPFARPPLTLSNRFEAIKWSLDRSPKSWQTRIRISTYDFALNDVKPSMVVNAAPLETVRTGYPTSQGGILLLGCTGLEYGGATNLIAYLSPSGGLSPLQKMSAGSGGECPPAKFGSASSANEAQLLELTHQGPRITTVRFSD